MRVFGKGEWKNSLREGSYVSTIVKQEALVKTPKCDSRSVLINSSKDLCHTGLKKLTCIYNRLLLQGKGRGLYKCWHEAKFEVMFLQESIFVPSSHLLDVTVNTWYKTISNEALVCVCVMCAHVHIARGWVKDLWATLASAVLLSYAPHPFNIWRLVSWNCTG